MSVNPWINLSLHPPYVLPYDVEAINSYNIRAKDNYRIQLDALPEPFFGNKNAPVVLLGLNPGFDDKDPVVHAGLGFQTMLRNNYQHAPAEYPFYFLNPEFQNPGRDWWERKLRPLMAVFSREILSRSLLCVEYFPYHSRKYSHGKLKLQSQQYGFSLVREALERKASVVIMRAKSLWYKAVPELMTYPLVYTLNSPQNVIISSRNCSGFDKLVSVIQAY